MMQTIARTPLTLIHQDLRHVAADVGCALQGLAGKTLLVTGANGFLASFMADTVVWLNEGGLTPPCRLIALVRKSVGTTGRLAHLLGRPDVHFLTQDVCSPVSIDARIDFIVHAASKASPKDYLAHPIDTMDANAIGTRRMLELAREKHAESFLLFSSSEIYGELAERPQSISEECPGGVISTGPRACYTESKRYAEALGMAFWREHGTPVKIVRPFHVYGPGMRLDDGRVVADFVRCRLRQEPIQMLSDGRAVRSFCYISDATAGFWKALLSPHNGEAFNIGTDADVLSIRDLASLVARLEEPELPVTFATEKAPSHIQGAPSEARPDLTKARKLLDYQPRVRLTDGLSRMVDWYRTYA